jgi:hypothetical protein
MVSVEHPDPPEEAKFNTESKGDVTPEVDELSSGDEAHANFSGVFQRRIMPGSPEYETFRVQEVIIQRLLKELCQIDVLKQRVLQGCELDAAQREKLGREDELFTALEEALDVAEAAVAVPQTGPGSPQKSEVQSALDEPRPQQPRVVVTQTRPSGPQEHKERSALVQRPQQSCATEAQIGPNSQHKEQSALVQRPQQPRATVAQIGPESPRKREEQSALAQRPQQPSSSGQQRPTTQSQGASNLERSILGGQRRLALLKPRDLDRYQARSVGGSQARDPVPG